MSYYRIFKPSKETMEQFDYSFGSADFAKSQMKMVRAQIRTKVMYPGDLTKDTFSKMYFDMMRNLKNLKDYVQDNTKKNIYNGFLSDKENEVVLCGRQYSNKDVEDIQELLENACEKLMLLMYTPSGSMADKDNDSFYSKLEMVDTELDYFIEEAQEIAIWDIIETIEDTEQPDDYNDYTSTSTGEQKVPAEIIPEGYKEIGTL